MKIPRKNISRAIASQTLKYGVTRKLSKEVAKLLLATGQVHDIDSILRDIQEDWAESGYVEVIAETAFPISSKVRGEIQSYAKQIFRPAHQIVITEQLNPQILGGVRLHFANRQLDISISTKLNKFKQLVSAGGN